MICFLAIGTHNCTFQKPEISFIFPIYFFQSMTRHFKTIPVAEKEALTYFIYMVKTNKSKLDRDRREGIDAD